MTSQLHFRKGWHKWLSFLCILLAEMRPCYELRVLSSDSGFATMSVINPFDATTPPPRFFANDIADNLPVVWLWLSLLRWTQSQLAWSLGVNAKGPFGLNSSIWEVKGKISAEFTQKPFSHWLLSLLFCCKLFLQNANMQQVWNFTRKLPKRVEEGLVIYKTKSI